MNRRQPFFQMFTLAAAGGDQRGSLLTQRAGRRLSPEASRFFSIRLVCP
jgi:hypothetical protein